MKQKVRNISGGPDFRVRRGSLRKSSERSKSKGDVLDIMKEALKEKSEDFEKDKEVSSEVMTEPKKKP